MLRILFVCTGNTCRSPMAEGLCRSFLGHFRLQEEVEVASAGLNAMAGGPASREAVAIMAERGIDLSGHQTACLTDRTGAVGRSDPDHGGASDDGACWNSFPRRWAKPSC